MGQLLLGHAVDHARTILGQRLMVPLRRMLLRGVFRLVGKAAGRDRHRSWMSRVLVVAVGRWPSRWMRRGGRTRTRTMSGQHRHLSGSIRSGACSCRCSSSLTALTSAHVACGTQGRDTGVGRHCMLLAMSLPVVHYPSSSLLPTVSPSYGRTSDRSAAPHPLLLSPHTTTARPSGGERGDQSTMPWPSSRPASTSTRLPERPQWVPARRTDLTPQLLQQRRQHPAPRWPSRRASTWSWSRPYDRMLAHPGTSTRWHHCQLLTKQQQQQQEKVGNSYTRHCPWAMPRSVRQHGQTIHR